MNNSLKTFMAITLAFLGFAIGNACVEKPEHDLAAQKKMLAQGNKVNRNQINRNAAKKARLGKAVANPRYKINANGPWKGEKDALVTIIEVSDFQCPFCSRVEPTMKKIMKDYAGKVKVVWRNNPLGFHKNAMPAAEASYVIYKLKGDKAFWTAHDKFFKNQRGLTKEFLANTAKELGVNMTQYNDMISKHVFLSKIKADQRAANVLGARGTPAFFINGRFLSGAQPYANFKKIIDVELAHAERILKTGVSKANLYKKITEKGLTKAVPKPRNNRKANKRQRPGTPDPSKYYYNDIKDAPMKGTGTLVTIVEYSDFQCPFCGRVEPTMKKIMEEYKGKVRVMWKNNPLSFHKNAMPAAEAAYAIYKLKGDKAFWAAHDKLFKNQRKLNTALYTNIAKELGVDMGKFEDMTSKHINQGKIKATQREGAKVGARGTPAFFINGRFISGAQPFANFKRVIDVELAKAEAMVKKGVAADKVYDTIMKRALRVVKAGAPQAKRQRPGSPDPSKYYYNDINGAPMRGSSNAIVTIVEYSDFQCPFCGRVEPTLKKIMEEYKGDVRVMWKNNPLGFHKNAMPAAEAAYAIYKIKGDKAFWAAHDKFYKNQRKLSTELYTTTAKELGVDMAKFNDMTSKHVNQGKIKATQREGAKVGARGTPAFFINGRFISGAQPFANFKKIIDEELVKAKAMVKKGVARNKVYDTIMKNALKVVKAGVAAPQGRRPGTPDPAKYYYNDIKDAPMKGTGTMVTIVEYSDFQCPFCGRVEPTLKKIMETYKGKVRVMWKNNPLSFHKNAMPAAEAAYAVYKLKGDKAFWAAHDKLFKNQRSLSPEFYTSMAKELGVDMAKFNEMTSKHVNQGKIKATQREGAKVGARGTPAFFINGRFLSGARPFEHFKKLIDEELAKAEVMVKKGTPKTKIYETIMKNAEKTVK